MTHRPLISVTVLLCLGGALLGAAAQPAESDRRAPDAVPGSTSALGSVDWRVPELRARLLALRPQAPLEYFELAEEVAAEIDTDAGRRLARQLLVLAYELDRRAARPIGLGRSVSLVLASLAESLEERRWLVILAETSGDELAPGSFGSISKRPAEENPTVATRAASAIEHARAGEGREAAELAAKPDVAAMLQSVRPVFGPGDRLIREARERPTCSGCRNRRTAKPATDSHGPERLCDVCRGNPGPSLTEAEFLGSLRAEAALVGAAAGTWAGQPQLDQARAFREPDLLELASYYVVDPGKAIWQAAPGTGREAEEGRWVAIDGTP